MKWNLLAFMLPLVASACASTPSKMARPTTHLADDGHIIASVADRQFMAEKYEMAEKYYSNASRKAKKPEKHWELGVVVSRFAQGIARYNPPVGRSEIGEFVDTHLDMIEELEDQVNPDIHGFFKVRFCRVANQSLQNYKMAPQCDEKKLIALFERTKELKNNYPEWESRTAREIAVALSELGKRHAAQNLIRGRKHPSTEEKRLLTGQLRIEAVALQSLYPQVAKVDVITRADAAFVIHRELGFSGGGADKLQAREYRDVQSHPFRKSFEWMEKNNLCFIRWDSSHTVYPNRPVERREVAMLLADLMERFQRKNRRVPPVGKGADNQRKWTDLANTAPSYPAILKMALLGGITTKEQGRIQPYETITGAELLTMVQAVKSILQ